MNSTLQDASNKEVAGIAIVVLVLVVSPIIIILVRNAVATIQVSENIRSISVYLVCHRAIVISRTFIVLVFPFLAIRKTHLYRRHPQVQLSDAYFPLPSDSN